MRRFVFASLFSILYLAVLGVFYTQDRVDRATVIQAGLFVFAFIVVFYCLFRTGVNLRFPDPSLTGWQFFAAVLTMLFVVYRAADTRVVFASFFAVAVMFGMFRRDIKVVAILGSVSIVLFALLAALRYENNGDDDMLRLDLLQCFVMAVTFPWILFVGGYMYRIEQGLTAARVKLVDIEEQARRDELTGIYNRRALIAAMHDQKQRADTTGQPFSICMIDIDLFKRYNDEFDHLTGDDVLRTFAHTVQSGLRTTDFFGRYGGEEFVQILPQTVLEGAVAHAERLRERLRTLEVPVSRDVGPFTVSIGVAQYAPHEPIDETLARADRALYRAKRLGRDRVEC